MEGRAPLGPGLRLRGLASSDAGTERRVRRQQDAVMMVHLLEILKARR